MFEEFREINSSWNMVGNYEVEGSYAREFTTYNDHLVISSGMVLWIKDNLACHYSLSISKVIKKNNHVTKNTK